MKTTLAIALVAGMSVASTAHAATFNSSTDFFNNNNVSYTEDFSSLPDATVSLTGPQAFATGLTVTSESNDLFSAATGQSTNTSVAIGSNNPLTDSLTLALGGVFDAFGLDIYQNTGGGSQTGGPVSYTLETFLAGMLVETFMTNVAPNGGSYFGFNTANGFDAVNIMGVGMFEVVDNVSAGNATSVVPLPASLPLLLAGLGALGLMRKRRKAA